MTSDALSLWNRNQIANVREMVFDVPEHLESHALMTLPV